MLDHKDATRRACAQRGLHQSRGSGVRAPCTLSRTASSRTRCAGAISSHAATGRPLHNTRVHPRKNPPALVRRRSVSAMGMLQRAIARSRLFSKASAIASFSVRYSFAIAHQLIDAR